jgi:3-deoxy-manno-octulosonate cytidylyltransferase (CMP-KDO synthetase)
VNVLAVIPARFASTRLPGKPLADLGGFPMIEWVYRAARAARSIAGVVVATDDPRIRDAVAAFGGEALMTSPGHASGTDRMAEVAELQPDYPVLLNVQGDEPLLDPAPLDALVEGFLARPGASAGTLVRPARGRDEVDSPQTAKVVCGQDGTALYFSRSPIPFERDSTGWLGHLIHIGVYIYRREFLRTYAGLAQGPLERLEKLEQLRVLEHGHRMMTVRTEASFRGVDTAEDLERVRAEVAARGLVPR